MKKLLLTVTLVLFVALTFVGCPVPVQVEEPVPEEIVGESARYSGNGAIYEGRVDYLTAWRETLGADVRLSAAYYHTRLILETDGSASYAASMVLVYPSDIPEQYKAELRELSQGFAAEYSFTWERVANDIILTDKDDSSIKYTCPYDENAKTISVEIGPQMVLTLVE